MEKALLRQKGLINQKELINQEVSYRDIARRFPVLKDAKPEEMQDIIKGHLSPLKWQEA